MIKEIETGLLITLKIIPNSSRNELIIDENFIKVKLTAQPIENKANKALVEYISKSLKVPKSNIEIVKGNTSKDKTVFISVTDKSKKDFIISKLTNF